VTELRLGATLGRYRVEALLGHGSTGSVYAAEDVMLERRVALKMLLPELARVVRVQPSARLNVRKPTIDGQGPRRDPTCMPTYLVERYVPGAKEQLARASGPGIRHLRTIFVPGDELCFSLYEAPSQQALEEASGRLRLRVERISEAIELPAEAQGSSNQEGG
jgi:serine/threonine protein kinase